MSWNIRVEGGKSVRLPTAGKYCEQDIVVTATGDSFLNLKNTMTEYHDDTITDVSDFDDCVNLKMIVLPKVTHLGNYKYFINCPKLEVVDFSALNHYAAGSWMNEDTWEVDYLNPLPDTVEALVNRGGLFQMGELNNQMDLDRYGSDPSCGISYTRTRIYIPREYIKAENFVGTEDEEEANGYIIYPNGADWDYIWKSTPERIRAIEDYTVDGTVTGALDLAKMGIE